VGNAYFGQSVKTINKMSWDVVVFKLSRKVNRVEEIDETILIDIGTNTVFKKIIEKNFHDVVWDVDWGKIERKDYSIEFSLGDSDGHFSNTIFHLYGENAIYEIVELCKKNNWQAYDTGLGQMLDLDDPKKNGYENHQKYVRQILDGK
jgi:hypothetical protein